MFRLVHSLIFPPLLVQRATGSILLVLKTGAGCMVRWSCGTVLAVLLQPHRNELLARLWLMLLMLWGWSLSCQTRKSWFTSDKASEDCSVTPAV